VAVAMWQCGTVAVAAVCQLLEEFEIVFAKANLLNKQSQCQRQSQDLNSSSKDCKRALKLVKCSNIYSYNNLHTAH